MRINSITAKFVQSIPIELEEGILYISDKYRTATHLCACGCKGKTVTPLGIDGWIMTNADGVITLRPSIGNWAGEVPYHAHYHITNNTIEWLD